MGIVEKYRAWRKRCAALKEAHDLKRDVLSHFPEGTQCLKVDLLVMKWRKARQIEKDCMLQPKTAKE